MKLLSILNKPAVKANNKQTGIVFLEYVIMAFIITVAVICALWWFYWHLQQMTWEVKQKLDTLKGLSCELSKPGEVQPTPAGVYVLPADAERRMIQGEIPYPNQRVVVHNTTGERIAGYVFFFDEGKTFNGLGTYAEPVDLNIGESGTVDYTHSTPLPGGPWRIGIQIGGYDGGGLIYPIDKNYSVTISQIPP